MLPTQEIFNLHKRGIRRKDIAKTLHITQKEVDKIIGKEKFKIPKVKFTPEVFKEFYGVYNKENVKDICVKFGRTVGEIRRLLLALDFEIPNAFEKHSTKSKVKEISDLYAKGNSIGLIARTLCIPRATVSKCIHLNKFEKGITEEKEISENIKSQERKVADSIKNKYRNMK